MASRTASAKRSVRVLPVEDEREERPGPGRVLAHARAPRGDVERAGTLGRALALVSGDEIGVVLPDLSLPDSEGMVTFERTLALAADVPIVSAHGPR